MSDLPSAFYEPAGSDEYLPTELVRGPWDPRHQHAGPPSALLARAVEACAQVQPGQIARLGVDILGPVPSDERLRTRARILRPGRRIEQIEATLETAAGGDVVMRANAWRMVLHEVDLPADSFVEEEPLPGPLDLAPIPRPGFWRAETGYIDGLDWRFARGSFDAPGPAAAWSRLRATLVAGEPVSALEHTLVMGDAASGISSMLDWRRHLFVNVNFDVHLLRPPAGEWLAMDAVTRLGTQGAGLAASTLHDEHGRFGMTTQSLLVAPR